MNTVEDLTHESLGTILQIANLYYAAASEAYDKALEEKDDRKLIGSLWAFKDAFRAADVFLDRYEPVDSNDTRYRRAQDIYNNCYHKIKQYRITINGKEVA